VTPVTFLSGKNEKVFAVALLGTSRHQALPEVDGAELRYTRICTSRGHVTSSSRIMCGSRLLERHSKVHIILQKYFFFQPAFYISLFFLPEEKPSTVRTIRLYPLRHLPTVQP
jgi:hypothetical protein